MSKSSVLLTSALRTPVEIRVIDFCFLAHGSMELGGDGAMFLRFFCSQRRAGAKKFYLEPKCFQLARFSCLSKIFL